MSKDSTTPPPPGGHFLVYQTEDGKLKIDVRFEGETVWLTQQHMAELFQTTQQNVSLHVRNIYEEGELAEGATHKESLSVRQEGTRSVQRRVEFYNLDAIISVGYRVKSAVATRFRIWATRQLREYIVKGFLLDDERLKNPDQPFDYFEVHWAITGQTAAEIVHGRVDAAKPNLGLTNWRGAVIRKQDVAIAKNYLNEPELAALNNLVEQYLVFAQGQAMRRVAMHMADWTQKLDGFLTLNDRDILTDAGRISHEIAQAKAELEYDKFKALTSSEPRRVDEDFERATKDLKKLPKSQKPKPPKK